MYQPGYSISWNKQVKNTLSSNKIPSTNEPTFVANRIDETETASIENSIAPLTKKNLFSKNDLSTQKINSIEECDKIFLKNGDGIKAKVIEIAKDEVKYKKCDSPDGPIFNIENNKVLLVLFANGERYVPKEKETDSEKSKEKEIEKPKSKKGERTEKAEPNEQVKHKRGAFGVLSFIFALISAIIILLTTYVLLDLGIVLFSIAAFFALLALIFGLIGNHKHRGARVLAIIGLILGIIFFIGALADLAVVIAFA